MSEKTQYGCTENHQVWTEKTKGLSRNVNKPEQIVQKISTEKKKSLNGIYNKPKHERQYFWPNKTFIQTHCLW